METMVIHDFATLVATYGPLGMFLLSFVSNAIPYSTVPYLLWLIPLFSSIRNPYVLAEYVLVSSAGATLGKVVVYGIGRSFSNLGTKLTKKRDMPLKSMVAISQHKVATFITVFLVAALPVPDDVVYIPVGYAKYNVVLFTIALFLGKLIITTAASIYGVALSFLFLDVAKLPVWISIGLLLIVTLVVMYALSLVRWDIVESAQREKGAVYALAMAFKEIFRALLVALVTPFLWIKRMVRRDKKR